ncbi:MAG: GNAT family N-acetyltransferase [Chitinophagales bacterium]
MAAFQLLSGKEVDAARWNALVDKAPLPYAYTWYLDAVAPGWKAGVAGDYEQVMPLPVARRFFSSYVYQPLFCQQLGVVGASAGSSVADWLEWVGQQYTRAHYNLNFQNAVEKMEGVERTNLILPLNASESVQSGFSAHTRRQLAKAARQGVSAAECDASIKALLDFYVAHTALRDKHFKSRHQQQLQQLTKAFTDRNLISWFVALDDAGAWLAIAGIVSHGHRRIHLLPAVNEAGRKVGAMHFLTAYILNHYSDQGLLYDFEGSSEPGIARFYEGFGAVPQNYRQWRVGW